MNAADGSERERRRYAVEQAIAHNRIEGLETPPAALAVFEQWIAGEVDSDECTRRIHVLANAGDFVRRMRGTERY